MSLALNFGMSAVEPLPSGPPRVIRLPPDLSELIARYGRYDLIPPQAWEQWDRQQEEWRQRHKFNQNICKGENK